jgi:hypothetical protein
MSTEYIETSYNLRRRHSTLRMLDTAAFEAQHAGLAGVGAGRRAERGEIHEILKTC